MSDALAEMILAGLPGNVAEATVILGGQARVASEGRWTLTLPDGSQWRGVPDEWGTGRMRLQVSDARGYIAWPWCQDPVDNTGHCATGPRLAAMIRNGARRLARHDSL